MNQLEPMTSIPGFLFVADSFVAFSPNPLGTYISKTVTAATFQFRRRLEWRNIFEPHDSSYRSPMTWSRVYCEVIGRVHDHTFCGWSNHDVERRKWFIHLPRHWNSYPAKNPPYLSMKYIGRMMVRKYQVFTQEDWNSGKPEKNSNVFSFTS